MKLSFFLNMMGVFNHKWYVDNNIPPYQGYCSGRIDVFGVPDEPYYEYSVGIMEEESWGMLGEWLNNLWLDHLPTKEELFTMFESNTGYKIKWWNK